MLCPTFIYVAVFKKHSDKKQPGCGGLTENSLHRLMAKGTIRRSGLVLVGVTLLEEVSH